MRRFGLGLGLGLPGPQFPVVPDSGLPPPPEGFAYVVNEDGDFYVNGDGAYYITEIE